MHYSLISGKSQLGSGTMSNEQLEMSREQLTVSKEQETAILTHSCFAGENIEGELK
jgi:hypothetical protein